MIDQIQELNRKVCLHNLFKNTDGFHFAKQSYCLNYREASCTGKT
jgi:hypothetical protein